MITAFQSYSWSFFRPNGLVGRKENKQPQTDAMYIEQDAFTVGCFPMEGKFDA